MSEREAYKKKFEAEIELAHAKLAQLKAQAKNASADARIRYEQIVDNLEQLLDATKTKLRELGSSSEEAWEALKVGVEAAWGDFTTGLDNATAKLKR
jgi:ribosome-associated translation inhibitor RaiA